jgi:hypothetical protein
MKVLATKNFSSKIKSFTDRDFQTKLLSLINFLNSTTDIAALQNQFEKSNDVYFFRLDNYRVFFSVEENTVLLVDVVIKEGARMPYRNPRIDNSINPRINNSINPRINNHINPRINNSINPRINNSINPRINNALNPRINNHINPRINNSINPRINNALNPRINNSINPRINPSFNGYYFYDLDNNRTKFAINANEQVLLIFDFNLNFIELGIKHTYGYAVFAFNNMDYIYHISSDSAKGFNIFDLNNDWIGHVK